MKTQRIETCTPLPHLAPCFLRWLALAGVVAALTPPDAAALGSRIPNQDAAAIARGNAFVATADNPAAIYYNPAGITQLEGHNFQLGSLFYLGIYTQYEPLGSGSKVDSDPEILPVPNLHYVYSPKDSPFSFGLGVYAPFGLGVKWPKETPFRTGGIESKLSYLTINPVLAWEALPGLSLSAGPTFNYSQAQLRQGIGAVPGDIFTFRGDDWAFGFNAGVLWQPHRQWSFGLNYRSATTLDYDGHVSTKPSPPLPQRQSSSGSFDYPQIIAAGVSFRPTTNWNIEVNVDWTDWNTLNSVKFAGVASPLVLNWESSFFYEFGATRYLKNGYYVSAGYFFSEQTTTESTFTPIVPDTDLHIGSLGVGRKGERWDWAIAAQFIAGPLRTIDNHVNPTVNGRYQLWTPTLSFSLGYHF